MTCSRCGKPTYAGCGAHIEQVLGDVPPADRCRCRDEGTADAEGGQSPGGSWLSRLMGK
ncbi:MAG: hypothetical protein KA712_25060 [Myxococcales bacterium]|nr:hypothetical protein [Myxococcales bacterium]